MTNLEKINENQERQKKINEAIEKINIAAENVVIQFRATTKAREEFGLIAKSLKSNKR